MEKHEIICPCCETKLQVDAKTGEVIWQEKKTKDFGSLSDMVRGLNTHKQQQESLFKKQNEIQKDRKRLLDEKFKAAKKNADKDKSKPLRDFDLD